MDRVNRCMMPNQNEVDAYVAYGADGLFDAYGERVRSLMVIASGARVAPDTVAYIMGAAFNLLVQPVANA